MAHVLLSNRSLLKPQTLGKTAMMWSLRCTLLAFLLHGCGNELPSSVGSSPAAETGLDLEGYRSFIDDNTQFAFEFYQALAGKHPDNFVYAPANVSSGMAMLYAGSAGATAQEIAQVLHFRQQGEDLHAAFGIFAEDIATPTGSEQGAPELHVASSVWGRQDFNFAPLYKETLWTFHGAPTMTSDFRRHPEDSRTEINSWVEANTMGKTPTLLPPGSVTATTELVLVNTLSLRGNWQCPFSRVDDRLGVFTQSDKTTTPMTFMTGREQRHYMEDATMQVVRLPYKSSALALLLVLPRQQHLADVEAAMSAEWLRYVLRSMRPHRLHLEVPRFKVGTHVDLATPLQDMGVRQAFSTRDADFSGIGDGRNLHIQNVMHASMLQIDEDGTDAAAATATSLTCLSLPIVENRMVINHPFLFLLVDQETGGVLFMGRVANPAESKT